MPRSTKVRFLMLLGATAAVLGAGCTGEIGDSTSTSTFQTPDIAIGRVPLSYPVGTKDEILIEDARAHLTRLSADEDERPVLGVILFDSSQELGILDRLADEYDLTGGTDASVTLLVGDSRVGLSISSSTINSEWVSTQTEAQLSSLPPDLRAEHSELRLAVPPLLAAASLWGTPQALKQLWDDLPESIRFIGIAGHAGNLMGAWRHPLPSEALR